MTSQSQIDKWFMRGKDGLLILGGLGAIFLFLFKYYPLPDTVDAQAQEIAKVEKEIIMLRESDMRFSSRLDNFEVKQDYTNKGVDEVKLWLKSINSKVSHNN